MATQLYSHEDLGVFRLKVKHGLGALLFARSDFAAHAAEHQHPEAQISLLYGGDVPSVLSHRVGERTHGFRVFPGAFVYVPPEQPHRMKWTGTGSLINFYMDAAYFGELSEHVGRTVTPQRLMNRPDRSIYEVGRLLLDEYTETGAISPATIDHANALIVSRLFRTTEELATAQGTTVLPRARIQPAIDALSASPETDFDLFSLARLCHSSVFHFARSFSAHVGMAPFAFLRLLRLQKARELLRASQMPVSSVALAVGMLNSTHFARSFKRATGMTPREYRTRTQTGQP